MKKIAAIIQARLGSTRLPGKILLDLIPGKTALEIMLNRVGRSKLITQTIVATTVNVRDKKLVDFLHSLKQPFFVGSEDDVLDRYYQAAQNAGLRGDDVIVRLTSDCPVIDAVVIDEVIRFYLNNNYDYVANGLEPYTYPDGMDTEVFSFANLERAWREADKPAHREHVTFYFWKNTEKFKIGRYKNKYPNQENYRLTLDYREDYELLKAVCEEFYQRNPNFIMSDIINFLDNHPEVNNLNKQFARNVSWQAA